MFWNFRQITQSIKPHFYKRFGESVQKKAKYAKFFVEYFYPKHLTSFQLHDTIYSNLLLLIVIYLLS